MSPRTVSNNDIPALIKALYDTVDAADGEYATWNRSTPRFRQLLRKSRTILGTLIEKVDG